MMINYSCSSSRQRLKSFSNIFLNRTSICFKWWYTILFAHFQEYVQRDFPFAFQPFNIRSVEVSTAVQTNEFTPEHFNVRVISDNSAVAIKFHYVDHGVTSLSSNHLRTLATAPLSVSGDGCGRWNTRLSSNNLIPTREPSCSVTSAPSATNSASMFDHLILPLTGRLNTNSNVFWCLRFSPGIYLYSPSLCSADSIPPVVSGGIRTIPSSVGVSFFFIPNSIFSYPFSKNTGATGGSPTPVFSQHLRGRYIMPENIINFPAAKQDRHQPVSKFPFSDALRVQSEQACVDNYINRGDCGCPFCDSHGGAQFAVSDESEPRTFNEFAKFVAEKTGQSVGLAKEHLEVFADLGVIRETEEGSGLYIGC